MTAPTKPLPDSDAPAVAERARRIAAMTRQGQSAAEIAMQLRISARTVARYRARLADPGWAPRGVRRVWVEAA